MLFPCCLSTSHHQKLTVNMRGFLCTLQILYLSYVTKMGIGTSVQFPNV